MKIRNSESPTILKKEKEQVKQYKKIYTFGSFNPFHNGHLSLLEAGIKKAESIDLTIGKQPIFPYDLPYEIKKESIEAALNKAGMQDEITILSDGVLDVNLLNYDALLMGSDIACKLANKNNKFQEKEIRFFQNCSVICVERAAYRITSMVEQNLSERFGISLTIANTSNSTITGTEIRDRLINGKDLKNIISSEVWKIIRPHVKILKRTKNG